MSTESRLRKISVRIMDEPVKMVKEDSRRKVSRMEAPKDVYHLADLVFFFFGLVNMLPGQFFLVANDYWMYKLRDTQYDDYNLNNKTYYQKMFVSLSSMIQGFPALIAVVFAAKFAFRIDARKRFLITLGATSFLFVIFTILVKVNTDTWQTLFFYTAISVISIITIFHPLYSVTCVALISTFPSKYIKLNMYGAAVAGILSSCLQIISLSISDNPIEVAMIYFSSGTVIIMLTFCLAYFMKYSPVIQFFWKGDKEEHVVPSHSFNDFYNSGKQIWALIIILVMSRGLSGVSHPNITNLIVSDGYNNHKDNLWYSKYFIPTVTYLGANVFTLAGRFFGKSYIKKNNAHWFILLTTFIAVGIGPLFLFCNAQPRNHLPVLFPHDYEYIPLLAFYTFSESFIMTSHMLSTNQMAGEDTSEVAFVLLQVVGTLTAFLSSLLNPLFVKLL